MRLRGFAAFGFFALLAWIFAALFRQKTKKPDLYEEPKYNVYELLYQIKGLKEQLATAENKDKAQQKELTDLRATEQALRQELVRRTIDLECAQRAEKQLTTQLEEINAELDQQKKKIADLTETIDLLRSRANTATAPKEATVNTLSDLLD